MASQRVSGYYEADISFCSFKRQHHQNGQNSIALRSGLCRRSLTCQRNKVSWLTTLFVILLHGEIQRHNRIYISGTTEMLVPPPPTFFAASFPVFSHTVRKSSMSKDKMLYTNKDTPIQKLQQKYDNNDHKDEISTRNNIVKEIDVKFKRNTQCNKRQCDQDQHNERRNILKRILTFGIATTTVTSTNTKWLSSVCLAEDSPSSVFSSTLSFNPAANVDLIAGSSTKNADVVSATTNNNNNVYKQAFRPNAYYVDSTQPPTLLPISRNKDQLSILYNLGQGSGTSKQVVDRLNLNNILNKIVFGTIGMIQNTASTIIQVTSGSNIETSKSPSTFVCLGIPSKPKPIDIQLAIDGIIPTMLEGAIQKRKQEKNTNSIAIGLTCLPYSSQSLLDQYAAASIDSIQLHNELVQTHGVTEETIELYKPIWETIQSKYNTGRKMSNNQQQQSPQQETTTATATVRFLALAPDPEDCVVARTKGLQFVNPTKRSLYVLDPIGFINQVDDPTFRLYTDRSLLKDAGSTQDTSGFFSERILFHEAAASAVSKYASEISSSSTSQQGSFVTIVAPIQDVRFLNGINGRIERICHHLATTTTDDTTSSTGTSTTTTSTKPTTRTRTRMDRGLLANVSAESITTILLNPTAADTLSKTRYLRLEIGTGPDTIQYQTKVADYLWFSSTPRVNLLPRLMNG